MANRNWGQQARKDLLMFLPEDLLLVTDPEDPLFDPRAVAPWDDELEALTIDIMENEVIQPVTIVAREPKPAIVVGRRRYRACTEANRRLKEAGGEPKWLPAVWRKGDDSTLLGIVVSENLVRKDPSPLEIAALAVRLSNAGRTTAQIAARLGGVSQQTARNYIALGSATKAVRDALEAGKITAAMAFDVAKIDPAKQAEKLKEVIAAGKGADGLAAARAARQGKPTADKKGAPIFNPFNKRYVSKLREALSRREVSVDGAELLGFIMGEIDVEKLRDGDIRNAIKDVAKAALKEAAGESKEAHG